MKLWKPLAAGLGALAVTVTLAPVGMRIARGVRLVPEPTPSAPPQFKREESAALFIGVQKFSDPTLDVGFAADDAVDLAYMFSLDPRVLLVPPERVVIALSGRPKKEISKKRLEELVRAGATIAAAGTGDILTLLQKQSAIAGAGGILIVSIATHGFMSDGVHYVLGSGSIFRYPETALQMPRLLEIAARSNAQRSLFFVDTCRDRIDDVRGPSVPINASMLGRMGRVQGQVVFSAATAGRSAFEEDGNGVFTKAVLEGMSCKASLTRGAVTFGTLKPYVERHVRKWIKEHRDPEVRAATHVSLDGDSQNMPLAFCQGTRPAPPPGDVATVATDGSAISAYSANGALLWRRSVGGIVRRAEVADLDADGNHEVVAGADTITVFDRDGKLRWAAEQHTTLRQFFIADLVHGQRGLQIAALWSDGKSASRVSVHPADGQRPRSYDHPGLLQSIAIDRPTSHHGRKIIVAGIDERAGATFGTDRPHSTVALLDAKLERVWAGVLVPSSARIRRLEVVDYGNDAKRDIFVATAGGDSLYLDFEGNVLNGNDHFKRLRKPRR